jgi:flagellar FliL protein
MAEEKAQQAEPAGEAPKGGKSKLVLIAGALGAVLVLGGCAAWWLGLFGGGTKKAEATEHAAAEGGHEGGGEGAEGGGHGGGAQGDLGALAALDPFIANLNDEDGRRYLKATMQVEFFKGAVPPEFNTRLPQVRDLLLTLLSSKTFSEVRTPQGKAVLRDEIVTRLNHALRADVVKAVYFTEFIVQ